MAVEGGLQGRRRAPALQRDDADVSAAAVRPRPPETQEHAGADRAAHQPRNLSVAQALCADVVHGDEAVAHCHLKRNSGMIKDAEQSTTVDRGLTSLCSKSSATRPHKNASTTRKGLSC